MTEKLGTLPPVETLFPANERRAIVFFWARYWAWFLLLLPWMVLRQVGISIHQGLGAIATWNRVLELHGGKLRLVYMNNLRALPLTALFGERFTAIHYHDVLLDPGPLFGRRRLRRYLDGEDVAAVVATHAHEEHIGNAPLAGSLTGAPVYGTEVTLGAMREPEELSRMRRLFIGQPQPVRMSLHPLGAVLETSCVRLEVIESPGHCEGHASLFDPQTGVLFAGDSFMHTIFTSPNRDVSGAEWIETLERYEALDVRTMIGTHGYVFTRDRDVARRAFAVRHRDPREMITDKLRFMVWARDVVAEGERRGLPYSVIEASLFPWQRGWAWRTWFTDESGRLFSAGEFSRTFFVRSLSRTPERVPSRFPPFARLARALGRR